MNNSKKASKKSNEKANANETKVVTIEQLKETFLKCNKNVKQTAEKLGLVYLFAHRDDNNNLLQKGEKGYGNECRLLFNGEKYTQNTLNKLATGENIERKPTPKLNTSNGSKLEKLIAEKERIEKRLKELNENFIPAAKAAEEAKKAEAQNKASEKATLSIGKMINNYMATGMTAAEATEKVLKQVEEEAKKATANA